MSTLINLSLSQKNYRNPFTAAFTVQAYSGLAMASAHIDRSRASTKRYHQRQLQVALRGLSKDSAIDPSSSASSSSSLSSSIAGSGSVGSSLSDTPGNIASAGNSNYNQNSCHDITPASTPFDNVPCPTSLAALQQLYALEQLGRAYLATDEPGTSLKLFAKCLEIARDKLDNSLVCNKINNSLLCYIII